MKCSQQHKVDTGCSGTVDPTRYVKKADLVETPEHLNRDYSFLQNLGRKLHLGKRAGSEASGSAKKARYEKKPATRNGVYIKSLPHGMHRSNINKSAWNNKKKTFYWTVEWTIYSKEDQWTSETIIRPQVPDNLSLQELVADVFKKKGQEEVPVYQVFLHKVESSANNRQLIPLDTDKLLGDQLVGKTVLEFPTIYIVAAAEGLPPKHSIAGVAGSSSESESSEDSSSDSDSSSDDDESDDNDDDSDNSNDSGPEELSIDDKNE
ncbi:hypothetical protein TRVA0_007S03752 [Trichomonascus vanleenenianus]|uniref:Bcd1p n=1 Tax=Trichomonascus vanleenenianus TaxID=2268995 RepID=UPI003EC9CE17